MTPKKIVLHHSLTKDSHTMSWDNIKEYHTETLGWEDIGYHFGIEQIEDYFEILVGRMLNEVGAHTPGQNHDSLGICFIGNYDKSEVPPSMWNLGIHLVSSLLDVFKIDVDNVYGHNQFANYKTCPGRKFNVEAFKEQIRNNKQKGE